MSGGRSVKTQRVTMSGDDLSKEEHVDNEFLWNLKLLSEVIILLSSDGTSIHCAL